MTHLRQIMLEELRRRNYAESTIHADIHRMFLFPRSGRGIPLSPQPTFALTEWTNRKRSLAL